MENMNITSAKYKANEEGENYVIKAVIDGVMTSVPLDPANSHYAEILRQQSEGLLTIQDAD